MSGPINCATIKNTAVITLGDLESPRIEQIVKSFGVPYAFDAVAICAQDHGVPDPGHFASGFSPQYVRGAPDPKTLSAYAAFSVRSVPDTMNRLKSIADSAEQLPAAEVYVMDSGMAAILGASLDDKCRQKKRFLVLDIATSHTVGAAMAGEEIAGFFEYHTQDITLEKLEDLLRDLADGKLSHQQILSEGGHGAFLRQALDSAPSKPLSQRAPNVKCLLNPSCRLNLGAPWGDNMMTGTVGLLEALRRHKGLEPITYL